MLKIAICGGSGTGKGYICRIIEKKYSIPNIDTDKTVHDMYKNDVALINKLKDLFGEIIVLNGEVNRKELGKIVFADKDKLVLLNHTVHFEVRKKVSEWFEEKQKEGCIAAIADIPQLFESGMKDMFDTVIAVTCPDEIRIQRILSRDNISLENAQRRIAAQLSSEEYASLSDHNIINDGIVDIETQIDRIFKEVGLIE